MKLTFLGTAAAEGFPAVFCNCEHCRVARERGGKNIRTRSQSLINEDLLIDLPADTYLHFLQNAIRGDRISTLLITHSHSDHFYPDELEMHGSYYAHDLQEPMLNIVCSLDVAKILAEKMSRMDKRVVPTLSVHVAKPFVPMTFGEYEITPLPARHAPSETALMYLIRHGGRALLYAHDTGYFFDEVFAYLERNSIRLDGASFDCTNGQIPIKDTGTHMGFENIARVIERLRAIGAVDAQTKMTVNHFSHNASPLQEEFEALAKTIDCAVAYDGWSIEI